MARSTVFKAGASLLITCALAASGCAWGRFTELKKETPVVRLEAPSDYQAAFAESLAAAVTGDQVELYIGGAPRGRGGSVFQIGDEEAPEEEPESQSYCPPSGGVDTCGALLQPAGLSRAWSPEGTFGQCFVVGYGSVNEDFGLWTRCQNGKHYVYPVPDKVVDALSDGTRQDIVVATNRKGPQFMLAASAEQRRAWYYLPEEKPATELSRPGGAGDQFGATVGVASLGDDSLLAVGDPSNGEVWLYRVDEDGSTGLGCLKGASDFGRTMSTGDIDDDGVDDLVISDKSGVQTFSGQDLLELGLDADECADSDDVELARLECESQDDTGQCSGSGFGASLAVGDFDGDGSGEVAVSAPSISAQDVSGAGAVFVYSADGSLVNTLIASNSDEGAQTGSSLVALDQGDRDILAAGAVGADFVYLFYCSAGMGSVPSLRCQ